MKGESGRDISLGNGRDEEEFLLGENERRRGGRATGRRRSAREDRRLDSGLRERANETSLGAARKDEEKGVIGVVDLCVCAYIKERERAERVNLSVGAALPRGASHTLGRGFTVSSRAVTRNFSSCPTC